MSSGNKYHRQIVGLDGQQCTVDVYAVLVAFNVTCPARQHAIKKLLCSGIRGKGSAKQDLMETVDAVERAITLLPPESQDFETVHKAIRDAGSLGWDHVEDPNQLLQEMRGDVQASSDWDHGGDLERWA
jgi:hypothetical protein